MLLLSFLVVSYLVGSLSFAIIVSKSMKMKDPRFYGSGNAGATNVMRSGNNKAAILTLLGDFSKGILVVMLARVIAYKINYNINSSTELADSFAATVAGLCGVAVIIGHLFPIFFGFKGGKGVATAAGVISAVNFYVFLFVLLTWVVIFKLTKVSSMSAILATLLAPVFAYLILGNTPYFGAILIIAIIVVLAHKQNIIRLISGQEDAFKKK